MKTLILLLSVFLIGNSEAFGRSTGKSKTREQAKKESPKLKHALSFVTDIPIHSSLVYDYHFDSGVFIGLGFGGLPKPYYRTIGTVAANRGNNDAYKDFITSSFETNSSFRLSFGYRFGSSRRWGITSELNAINTEGEAGLVDTVQAVTGTDFTNLRNLLLLAGLTDQIQLSGSLVIGQVSGYYWWPINRRVHFSFHAGLAFVLESRVELSTESDAFNNSALGQAVIEETETELEAIVGKYGISPTVGFRFSCFLF